jgi:streptogramin lyase
MQHCRGAQTLGFRATAVLSAALTLTLNAPTIGASQPLIAAPIGTVTEFPVPTSNSGAAGITAGPDGNVWFTEFYANKIGKINMSGSVIEYPITTANSEPLGIAAGPDGNLWFVEYGVGKIGKITPAGSVIEYPVPTVNSNPYGITAGPDGNMWFTEANAAQIGKITPAGSVTEFPTAASGSIPIGITAGADGNLWFAEGHYGNIGRITTGGSVTEFTLPTTGDPAGIAAGPDGNLWFTEQTYSKIGRITTTGTIKQFPLFSTLSAPVFIAPGTDGKLWFAEFQHIQQRDIGSITTAGVIKEYPTVTSNSGPRGVAAGPDGNIWFTELYTDKIGRLQDASGGKCVLSLVSGFAATSVTVSQGGTVKWTFLGPTSATATDSSGMGLFDSGSKKLVSFFSYKFFAAGTYPYVDTLQPAHKGTIKVPIKVSPTTGTTSTTFTITWSSITAPSGYVFDVQIKRPGSAAFVNWMTAQTASSATFVPDAGIGTYSFRAQLRNTGNTKTSGYSPVGSIKVS